MDKKVTDLSFPLRGLDISTGFGDQRPMTCCEGTNVFGFEPSTDRSRGGSRPGLAKYIPRRVVDVDE